MEFIYGYIRNICIFMLVITLILNIFPEKSNKKYIKLFAGFLLLLLIFHPIVKYKKSDVDIEKVMNKYYKVDIDYDTDVEKNMEEIQTKMFERISEEYEYQSEKNNGN